MHDLEQPGAIMLEWWPEGADPDSTASQLGVAPGELRRVLNGRANISPELAAQLEAGGWSTAAFWMRLQAAYGRERRIDRSAATEASNQHFHSGW